MPTAFLLDPATAHTNHGSFGAVPRVVLEAQQRLQRRAEADPMRFLRVERHDLTAASRERVAAWLGADADALALVRNVTESIATVLSALAGTGRLAPGDVVVSTSLGYTSVGLAIDAWCVRTGATHVVVDVAVDAAPDDVVAALATALDAVGEAGRRPALVVVDEIASPTGGSLPVAALSGVAARARAAGALTFVDAAHAPGHVPTRPGDVGADFWTGTLHKWAYAVRGTSVLWAAPDQRERLVPLTTSAHHGRAFPLPFDLTGTDDQSGWWCLPVALDFWEELGGFAAVTERTRLLDAAVGVLEPVLGAGPHPTGRRGPAVPAPCLRLLALPDGVVTTHADSDRLYRALSDRGVEAQVVAHAGRGWLRLSAAPYNELCDYERLAEALADVLSTLRTGPGAGGAHP